MGNNRVTDPIAIEEQLHRILSSSEFNATARQKKFLRFVTQMFLEGRTSEIKGYTVATDVFGRKTDFDSKHGPHRQRRSKAASSGPGALLSDSRQERWGANHHSQGQLCAVIFFFRPVADSRRSSPETGPNKNGRAERLADSAYPAVPKFF